MPAFNKAILPLRSAIMLLRNYWRKFLRGRRRVKQIFRLKSNLTFTAAKLNSQFGSRTQTLGLIMRINLTIRINAATENFNWPLVLFSFLEFSDPNVKCLTHVLLELGKFNFAKLVLGAFSFRRNFVHVFRWRLNRHVMFYLSYLWKWCTYKFFLTYSLNIPTNLQELLLCPVLT